MDFFEWMVALENRHYRVLVRHRRHTNPTHCSFHTKMHPRFSSLDHSRILHLGPNYNIRAPLEIAGDPLIKCRKAADEIAEIPYDFPKTLTYFLAGG